MISYHKITTVWKRDPATNCRTLIEGEYATPEFEYLANSGWYFTEKIDGINVRVIWDGTQLTFRGRTDKAQMPPFLFEKLNEMFAIEKFEELYSDEAPMCLYGEGYGARIQKGGGNYIPDDVSFILFDVKVGDWWLKRDDVGDVALKLGIAPLVPIRGAGILQHGIDMVRGELPSVVGDCMAEGLVMRPAIDLCNRAGNRIIAKIKAKDFPTEVIQLQ